MRGAEAGGAAGFVRGVGRGLTGLAVKPITGVLDLISQTSEGVIASAKILTGEGAERARLTAPHRHQRLAWGVDHCVVPVTHLHGIIVAVLRRAIEDDAAEAAEAARKRRAAKAAAPVARGRSAAGVVRPKSVPPRASRLASESRRAPSTPSAQHRPAALGAAAGGGGGPSQLAAGGGAGGASALLDDVRELVSGRSAALALALTGVAASYVHHIRWPRSPYLLVISTRCILLARINRSAGQRAGGGAMGSGGGVAHLCWRMPTLTPSSAAAAAAAAPGLSGSTPRASPLPRGAGGDSLALRMAAFPDAAAGGAAAGGGGGRGRGGASTALIAAHLAYVHVLDSAAEVVREAAATIEALRQGGGAAPPQEDEAPPSPSGGGPPSPQRHVRTGPLPLMCLDALVQVRRRVRRGVSVVPLRTPHPPTPSAAWPPSRPSPPRTPSSHSRPTCCAP